MTSDATRCGDVASHVTSAVSCGLSRFVKNGGLELARVLMLFSETGIIVLLDSLNEHYGF